MNLDFPGASLGAFRCEGRALRGSLRQEALVEADGFRYDYNRHFAFGLNNTTDAAQEIDVSINCEATTDLPSDELLMFGGNTASEEFERIELAGTTDRSLRYRFRVPLAPRQELFVANYLFRPLPQLSARFDRLAEQAGARREVYAATVDGRDLVAYSCDEGDDKPTVLVTAGFHPTEGDTLGPEGILEFLATPDSAGLRSRYSLVIVPIVNPDGFARGYNACNTNEINFYWLFAADSPVECPEAHCLWALVERVRPVLYFDFHAYTFQGSRAHYGPYLKPHVFYRGAAVRRCVREIEAELLKISNGRAMRGVITYTPSTLASMITRELNTITYAKYHLHLAEGEARNKEIATASLAAATSVLSSQFERPQDVLLQPHGQARAGILSQIGAALMLRWGLSWKPVLGRAKRWLLRVTRPSVAAAAV